MSITSYPRLALSAPRLVVAALAGALLSGCAADPPRQRPSDGTPGLGNGRYATFASCSPRDGKAATCPGAACGRNAAGAPDGNTIDLIACGTLDIAFTSGVVVSVLGEHDLVLHVEGDIGGQTRIEASPDGVDYVLVGFIAAAPTGTPTDCVATTQGQQVLVDFDPCNLISNVSFLRLANEQGTGGNVKIDAVEARSFEAY